jgi:hypothetical protein
LRPILLSNVGRIYVRKRLREPSVALKSTQLSDEVLLK